MALVKAFGAWTSGGPAGGPAPAIVTINAPRPGESAWTGGCGGPGLPVCTPEYTNRPLPMIPGGPGQPTTATWTPSPGKAAPPPGEGWQGGGVLAPPPGPAPASSVSYGDRIGVTYGPPGVPSGYAPPPATPPSAKLFGLPPLLVIGAGGLLVFLIARRL